MLPADYQIPAGVLLVVVGLVACFAGYRLFRAVLTIYGFLLGALFASTLVSPGNIVAMLVALVVGGLVGAVALYVGYVAGVGLVGAGLGATIGYTAWQQWRGGDPGILVVLFFGAVGAGLAVVLQRTIVVVATAFLGSQTAVAGALALLSGRPPRRPGVEDVWVGHLGIPPFGWRWTFVAWVVLGIAGTIVQLRSGRPARSRSPK
jgi:hypothetical protein